MQGIWSASNTSMYVENVFLFSAYVAYVCINAYLLVGMAYVVLRSSARLVSCIQVHDRLRHRSTLYSKSRNSFAIPSYVRSYEFVLGVWMKR